MQNVLAPYSQERLISELKQRPFFSVSSDSSSSEFVGLADSFFEKDVQYLEADFHFDDPIMYNSTCLRLSNPTEWNALKEIVENLKLKDIDIDKLYQD